MEATTQLVFGAARTTHGIQHAGFESDRNRRIRAVRRWAAQAISAFEDLSGRDLVVLETNVYESGDPKLMVGVRSLRDDLEALRAAVADLEGDRTQQRGVGILNRAAASDLASRYSAALERAAAKAREWLAIVSLHLGEDDYLALGRRAFPDQPEPGKLKGPTVSLDDILG